MNLLYLPIVIIYVIISWILFQTKYLSKFISFTNSTVDSLHSSYVEKAIFAFFKWKWYLNLKKKHLKHFLLNAFYRALISRALFNLVAFSLSLFDELASHNWRALTTISLYKSQQLFSHFHCNCAYYAAQHTLLRWGLLAVRTATERGGQTDK